jgi:hypothetical protein
VSERTNGERIRVTHSGLAKHHRSGWSFALDSLSPLHSDDGILFDDFVERTVMAGGRGDGFGLQRDRGPWIGVFHTPPGVPDWFNISGQAPRSILNRPAWRESIATCAGLFTLSAYLRDWLAPRVPVPVESLVLPSPVPQAVFSPDRYRANRDKKVVHIGWWLRRFHSFYLLRSRTHRKVLLDIGSPGMASTWAEELRLLDSGASGHGDVETTPYLANRQYDVLLSENVVFLDLYDSSANCAVVECMARGTPLIVNEIAPVVEYLGHDYPLFFNSLEEAEGKLEDEGLLRAAHEHLLGNPLRGPDSGRRFREAVRNSAILQLASASGAATTR